MHCPKDTARLSPSTFRIILQINQDSAYSLLLPFFFFLWYTDNTALKSKECTITYGPIDVLSQYLAQWFKENHTPKTPLIRIASVLRDLNHAHLEYF
jgi:hypothetical protein